MVEDLDILSSDYGVLSLFSAKKWEKILIKKVDIQCTAVVREYNGK